MKKKYLGVIITFISFIGFSILLAMGEMLRYLTNYRDVSTMTIVLENFSLSFCITITILFVGVYLIKKNWNF